MNAKQETELKWEPSVYIPGRGVVYLTIEEVRDCIAAHRGETPTTETVRQFISPPSKRQSGQ